MIGSHQAEDLLKIDSTLTFPGIIKPAAYLGKNYTTNVYILNHKANCFSIKGLHHRRLYSKARELTFNGISKILQTGTITKIFFLLFNAPVSPVSHVLWLHAIWPKGWSVLLDRYLTLLLLKLSFYESLPLQTPWGAMQISINYEVLQNVWPKPGENI